MEELTEKEKFEKIQQILNELNIETSIVEHEPAVTTELADKFIEGLEGVRTKSMFITNKKKKNFYLVILDDSKRLDMSKFQEIVGDKQLRLVSEELLHEKMKLQPGVVSPFGLLFNTDHDIKFYFDKDIAEQSIQTFHPNTNTKTMFIKTTDLFKFVEKIGYEVNIIDL
ncbi:prolyl-tRNA synthetase associated domain-containing protein [Criibacterium bergeronii]|uniref:Prolyl-tRNA synthetase associated domain-containing protein n=1 Tax=Criibacterium bergeronii TaxID=1871336 RepID=A0A371IK26_9FIRM|nr:prolyl-tRNA synthetase associated domain-containing protein [Criibacterium bergeronii]MBS6062951.1 prolyl-tRNA synthetase associated domain-containing protein [Peptostreptococcaceae bacterium]RDY20852.1 prolyl-tRNA synthetase associated domain-containing protein [Criibacterium bergeronii]TRW25582.1 prolyl-tRNA synthetase associated domain-containing protein [Criibacterium bergeronii]